ncbi:MAG: hypothetical protein GXY33_00635 [Phycisphaerae bacterium]|nr:hypothetical protein [Phycisphaerae bacterium]
MNDKPSPKLSQKGDGPLPVWVYPLVTITLWVVGIWLFLHFFSAARIVLLGVLAGGALAAAVWPLARRVPGPRWLGGIAAVLAPVLIALGLIALVGWLLGSRLQDEMGQWPALRDGFNTLLDRVNSYLGLRDRITIETVWTNVRSFFNVSDLVSTATGFASGLLLAAVLLVFGAIYLLAEDPQRLIAPVVSLFRPRRREQIRGALGDLAPKLRW